MLEHDFQYFKCHKLGFSPIFPHFPHFGFIKHTCFLNNSPLAPFAVAGHLLLQKMLFWLCFLQEGETIEFACTSRFLSWSDQTLAKTPPDLVGGWATPLKNMSSSIGMMTFPILMGKEKMATKPPTSDPIFIGNYSLVCCCSRHLCG